MKNQGFAIVATLLIIAVIGTLVAGSLWLSSINQRINKNDAVTAQVVNVAQAGNAYWKAELVSLYRFMMQNYADYEDDINDYIAASSSNSISCGNYFAIGVDLNRDKEIDTGNGDKKSGDNLPEIQIPTDGQQGSVTVRFESIGSTVRLTAKATLGGSRATVVDEFNISTADMWNNAVFAGRSAQGKIQGSVEIRGSIHILGEGLAATDTALDVSGSFALGNTYRNIKSSLGVADLGLTNPDPSDLCATLRVRRGKVAIGSTGSQIGFAETKNADPFIDRMRGIYTNDGFSGAAEEDKTVYSENGMGAAYDAGDTYDFPELDQEMTPGVTYAKQLIDNSLFLSGQANDDRNILPTWTGGVAIKADGTIVTLMKNSTYLSPNCFTTPLFGMPPIVTPANNPNQFTLVQNSTNNFSCTKYRVVGLLPDPTKDEVVSEVSWTKASNELYIGGKSGVVTFFGKDLSISGGNGANDRVNYKGNGVLFSESNNVVNGKAAANSGGNIIMGIDFLPAKGKAAVMDIQFKRLVGVDSAYNNTYPASSLLGVTARNAFTSETSTNQFTVAIYAQEEVVITKQTLIAGAIVTKTFRAASQVPSVLYVPNVAEKLSRFMPGVGGKTYTVSNVAWSRQ